MKRSSLNIILFALALMASASCTVLDEPAGQEQGIGDYSISLSVFCQAPETRGDNDKPGIDALNENKLDYVDWFIFKSSDDTDAALVSGRGTPTGTNNTVTTVSLDNWVPTLGRNYYVYAVANYPTDEIADHDAMPKTLAGLKALSHTASFKYSDTFSVDGKQSSFIMRGGESVTFSDSDRGTAVPVNVPLERLAAKVSVRLTIPPAIDERETMPDGSMRYIQTWYPDLETIQVYLSFANAESTLAGTPVEYDMSKFFTYNRAGFEAQKTPGDGTYPSWDGGNWVITGTPFYSYPMSWDSESPTAPFIKVILKWKAYDESHEGNLSPVTETTADGPKFVRHQRNGWNAPDDDEFWITELDNLPEFYYKIPLVPMSETEGVLNANDWCEISANLFILGSTSDDLPVVVGGQYYVTDWGIGLDSSSDLKQATYLSLERYEYKFYAKDEITIPVHSSHDLEDVAIGDITATYNDYSAITPVLNTPVDKTKYPVAVTANGNQSVTLRHVLNNDLTSEDIECSPITYTFQVRNTAGLTSGTITVVQYPAIYISAQTSNSYVFVNGVGNHFNTADYPKYSRGSLRPVFDYGDTSGSYETPTFGNSDTYTDANSGIEVQFIGATLDGNNKKMPSGSSIKVSAPSGLWIYMVEYTYNVDASGTYNTHFTYESDIMSIGAAGGNVSGTITRWCGEAQSSQIINYKATDPYHVTKVKVYYHNKSYLGNVIVPDFASASDNENMYTITVTDVSQLSYFVADARSSTPKDYVTLLGNGGEDGEENDYLRGYYPLNLNSYNDNAIAPQFIVASTYGGSYSGTMRFENAEKRCAGYQENGYPAGRWRIPSDAEIGFIVNLSALGKIPTLFSGRFWGSSGAEGEATRVNPPGTGHQTGVPADETEIYTEYNIPAASVRCVYPSWYWGDEPVSTYLTSWSGWQNQ